MVKSIQVFKYDYAPTQAEFREKIGTRATIKRPIREYYRDNNIKNLDHLETRIRNIEDGYEEGILGRIDHQFFHRLNIGGGDYTHEDDWDEYFFYISSKHKLLIMGGNASHRNTARNILIEKLGGDISFIQSIFVKTEPMMSLVNKIKFEGPKEEGEYKNIMIFAEWKYPKKTSHKGAKGETVTMHIDESDPKCVSKFDTFKKNRTDSESFDTTLLLYRCNGILNQKVNKGLGFQMFDNLSFLFPIDPTAEQWILFVIQTVRKALSL